MAEQQLARFAFPKLVVRDLEKEVAFYQAVIGYGEGQRIVGEIAGRPIEEILLSAADGTVGLLILTYKDGKGPEPSPSGVISGFFTPDIAAFEQRVLAAGGSVHQPAGPLDMPGSTSQLAFYADPEGYLLEVIEG